MNPRQILIYFNFKKSIFFPTLKFGKYICGCSKRIAASGLHLPSFFISKSGNAPGPGGAGAPFDCCCWMGGRVGGGTGAWEGVAAPWEGALSGFDVEEEGMMVGGAKTPGFLALAGAG